MAKSGEMSGKLLKLLTMHLKVSEEYLGYETGLSESAIHNFYRLEVVPKDFAVRVLTALRLTQDDYAWFQMIMTEIEEARNERIAKILAIQQKLDEERVLRHGKIKQEESKQWGLPKRVQIQQESEYSKGDSSKGNSKGGQEVQSRDSEKGDSKERRAKTKEGRKESRSNRKGNDRESGQVQEVRQESGDKGKSKIVQKGRKIASKKRKQENHV